MEHESQGENHTSVYSRINVSMVSLKWGDVLSTLLPGALALFALAPYFQFLNDYVEHPDKISVPVGVALLIAAALAGGILEAFTRVTWELCLTRWCPSPRVLGQLTVQNLDLYEFGVQGSYKYATFYANFAWAIALIIAGRLYSGDRPWWSVITFIINFTLILIFILLLVASYIQWTYFVRYLKGVFEKEGVKDAGQLATTGNVSEISEGSPHGKV